jgi:adenylyltransferase/sulfurtransferase
MNKEINAPEAAKLKEADPNIVFLDVREDHELEICRIEGALDIPMAQISTQMELLPRVQQIIVCCHLGMRSMHVIDFLTAHGWLNLFNLAGGIHAWSLEIDPDMAQY